MSVAISVSTWCFEGMLLTGRKTLGDIVEVIADMGVDRLDLTEDNIGCCPRPNLYELKRLRNQISSCGLKVTSCWFLTDLIRGSFLTSQENVVSDLREYVAATEAIGGKFLVIHSSRITESQDMPPGMSPQDGYSILMDILGTIVPTAEECGITVCLEASRAHALYNSPEATLRLVKDVGSQYVRMTPDFDAWRRPATGVASQYTETPAKIHQSPLSIELFRECLEESQLIHAKFLDFDEEGIERNYPYKDLLPLVNARNTEQYLTIEYSGWIPEINPGLDPIEQTERAIRFTRRILQGI